MRISVVSPLAATDVWTAATRTLTAFAAQDLFLYPLYDSIYPVTSPASGAAADTFGAWVQISADVGVGRVLRGITFAKRTATAINSAEVEIGTGAAGVEVAVARATVADAGGATVFIYGYIPFDRALADNVRLSVRVRDNNAAALTYGVGTLLAA